MVSRLSPAVAFYKQKRLRTGGLLYVPVVLPDLPQSNALRVQCLARSLQGTASVAQGPSGFAASAAVWY